MNLNPSLFQHQELKLNMTQKLAQSIFLLQYSAGELASLVNEMALDNPLIEVENMGDVYFSKKINEDYLSKPAELTGNTSSLYDYLKEQIMVLPLSEQERKTIEFFILNINESGYLKIEVDETCKLLGVSVKVGKKMLNLLQQLDPPGIGARNLQECLLIQLERQEGIDKRYLGIIKHYFNDFVNKKWNKIVKAEGISLKELQDLMDRVQKLQPKPGAHWSNGEPDYVVPDIIITKRNGKWNIQLTEDQYFDIKVNQNYYNKYIDSTDPQISDYIRKKYEQYQWLKKSIMHRKETIEKLTRAIIDKQEDFLLDKTEEIKPTTMGEIADEIGVHESTVSRTVKNKYLQTATRTIPLRGLFSHTVHQNRKEEDVSADYVKKQLKLLIDGENKNKPYSDQELAVLLEKGNIFLKRRTIAKYREQLQIPPSLKRKRYDQ